MTLSLNSYQDYMRQYAKLFPDNYYNLGWSCWLSKNLMPALLEKSFNYLIGLIGPMHSVLSGDEEAGYCFKETDSSQCVFETVSCTLENCQRDMEEFAQRPFDLFREWPIRAKLYSLEDHSFIFLIVFHHICIDGVTGLDFFSMLAKVYDQLEADGTYLKLEMPEWEDTIGRLNKEQRVIALDDLIRWQKVLDDGSLSLFFPDMPEASSYSFEFERFELGEDLMAGINHAARQNGVTAFIVVLAAWMFALSRITGQKGVFVENSINMRPAKLRNLVGFFVNSLPLFANFDKLNSAKDLMSALAQQWKAMKPLRHHTWSDLSRQLKENGMNLSGRTNIGINYAGWSDSFALPLSSVDSHFFRRLDHNSALDLLLEVEPTKIGLSRICYHSIFSKEQIQSLIESLRTALQAFVADSDRALSSISLVPLEKQLKLAGKYEKQLDSLPPLTESINERFERIAMEYPDHAALVYDGNTITYRALLSQVVRDASCLRSLYRSHFQQELPLSEPIGIYMRNKCQAIIGMLSILRAGGAYVNLDPSYPSERISFMAKDYGMRCILTDEASALSSILPSELYCFSPESMRGEEGVCDCPEANLSALAYIISTSGTTGQPKGVPIRHSQLLTLLQSGRFVADSGQRVLQFASLSFDVSVWEVFATLLNGSTLVIATEDQRLDLEQLCDLLIQQKVSAAQIPPVLLSKIPKRDFPDLKAIWAGGEATSKAVIEYWRKGRMFYNGYGPSESTVCSSACLMEAATLPNDVGEPLVGVTYYVLDEHMNLVPDFVRGELYIGGPQVTSGYINRPELNAVKFVPNPFATERDRALNRNLVLYRSGDLVSKLPNGHLLFHGRIDFQVKVHGFRIELGEIESVLNQHPEVARCVVQARDAANDKVLVAYVLPAGGKGDALQASALRAYLSERLPSYMIPARWAFVAEFPMTVNGKIDLKALPDPVCEAGAEDGWVAPATSEESILEAIASETLQMEHVSVDANLFDLGLTSIQVMMMVSEVSALGLELSASSFYRYQTIREIARHRKASICFWHQDEDPDKPVAVIVCGDTYFAPDYLSLAEHLSKTHSVLVLESYHEYFSHNAMTDWYQTIETYLSIMLKALNGREVRLLCGFCLGGEMALGIASLLNDRNLMKPQLLLIDSFANRDKSLPIAMDYPGTSEAVNARRQEETNHLLQTQALSSYQGDMRLVLAGHFTTERMQLSDAALLAARRQFEENAGVWQRLYPQCRIEWRDAAHWDILKKLF